MSRPVDSGRVDLQQVFMHLQSRMLAHLEVGGALEHASTCGAASEAHWLNLFNAHLPERYRASSAFIVDSGGRRSRQIDIAIYDRFYSPLIFPYESGFLVPAESVYAVVEVKQTITRQYMRDAGLKIASVRRLHRTSVPVPFAGGAYPPKAPHPILGIVVATRSVWPKTFERNLVSALDQLNPSSAIDLGCVVTQGAFEAGAARPFCTALPDEAEPCSARSTGRAKPGSTVTAASKKRSSAQALAASPGKRGPARRTANAGCLAGGSSSEAATPPRTSRARSTGASSLALSDPSESLIWFMLRLIERLRALGNAPAADLMSYGRTLKSLR